jgi:hypothetical protein
VTPLDDSKDDSTDDRAGSPQVANGSRDLDLLGVVEPALSRALLLAAEAGQWAVVSQLANELEARRVARQSQGASGATVVPLCVRRSQTQVSPFSWGRW